MWLGHTQSLKACEGGLLLNVNPTAVAFVSALPVEKFLQSILNVSNLANLPSNLRGKASNLIKNLKVCSGPPELMRRLLMYWLCSVF